MQPIRALFYGDAGSGKTAMVSSAFWDFKEQKLIRPGRLLLIGQEDNDALGIPEEYIRRFVSPAEDPLAFAREFREYTEGLVMAAAKGEAPEVIAVDSWSEWNHLFIYEHDKKGGDADKWAKYDEAKDHFFSAIQNLNPHVLNAHILATARVDEKKKGVFMRQTGETQGGDPGYWSDAKYIPAMVGWARRNLSHYFDLVVWVEAEVGDIETPSGALRRGTHHRYYMIQSGDALVKNRFEHSWLAADLPDYLTNVMYDDILEKLDIAKATTKTPAVKSAKTK